MFHGFGKFSLVILLNEIAQLLWQEEQKLGINELKSQFFKFITFNFSSSITYKTNMLLYLAAAITIFATFLYHIFQTTISDTANPIASLAVTYCKFSTYFEISTTYPLSFREGATVKGNMQLPLLSAAVQLGSVCKVNFVKSFYENRYLVGKERRSFEVIFTTSKSLIL